jgi:hypothetical protein
LFFGKLILEEIERAWKTQHCLLILSAVDSRRERFRVLGDGRRQPRGERMVKNCVPIVGDEKIRCRRMRCHL